MFASSASRSALRSAIRSYRPRQQAPRPRRAFADKAEAAPAAPKEAAPKAAAAPAKAAAKDAPKDKSWWNSAEFWGGAGAIAGWGMSGAAIYDAAIQGPEIISLNMTGVLIVYSSLFARWAWVVKPQNLLLSACHVTNVAAQLNQMRRALEYKSSQGQGDEVKDITMKAAATAAAGAGFFVFGPAVQGAIVGAELGVVSAAAAAPAGPFTVHFWAPMSKWLISGASFMDLDRPTDKISIAQYTALTFTGMFFSRYSLLVNPINYLLCSVNIALFGSSAWHLGRKVNADYIEGPKKAE
mmetsp:Transcript_12483/g.25928  ORF Transcript_12483/g.25928 Transcript_12483/m.25928 type:complete len:297 (-) Transcript_12483:199-1089(-)|eukprot:CAMPEP_0183295520 /NCGR_PEP_ID=MMETSP0160_2-20130417/3448_1 /TAXON_ID=2839 ORGANISM="Odontella Sinensis, Strain Grunow 1884" /NCGR_SAMPLE_ID=MMETSP0160_2 /ASSEMBLY_ACC=CAM_ASM_000250 /LENGTH=296 /DNA_ID=CAMNT_0025457013 /DNA_START=49 /DNA_END=939 /DNA_ORIENTATION=-